MLIFKVHYSKINVMLKKIINWFVVVILSAVSFIYRRAILIKQNPIEYKKINLRALKAATKTRKKNVWIKKHNHFSDEKCNKKLIKLQTFSLVAISIKVIIVVFLSI